MYPPQIALHGGAESGAALSFEAFVWPSSISCAAQIRIIFLAWFDAHKQFGRARSMMWRQSTPRGSVP